jgi:hypothetical protein
VTFHNSFALVDLKRQRIAIVRAEFTVNAYAAMAAAAGYHALYETEAPDELSRKLAGAYYQLGESNTPTGEELAAVAYAARAWLRARGGEITLNPEDLMEMAVPEDAPTPEIVLRLENGEDVLDQAWWVYAQKMRRFCLQEKSESPEVDLQDLACFEAALAAQAVNSEMLIQERRRQSLYQSLLGEEIEPTSIEVLSELAETVAEELRTEMRLGLELHWEQALEDQQRSCEAGAKTVCHIHVVTTLTHALAKALPDNPLLLEKILPVDVRARIRAASPVADDPATVLAQSIVLNSIFDEYLLDVGATTIDYPRLRVIASAHVGSWMDCPPTKHLREG